MKRTLIHFILMGMIFMATGLSPLLAQAWHGWNFAPWTNDADSGIAAQNTYTVAHCFGNNHPGGVTVNGVAFTESFGTSGTGWSISGNKADWSGDDNANITGASEDLAEEFIYSGNPRTVTMTGLTAGQLYEISFYSVAWETGSRTQTFTSPDGTATVINQDAYNDNNGIRITCIYRAKTASHSFTIKPGANGTFHLYAMTNKVVVDGYPSGGPLIDALTALKNHILGTTVLTGSQIAAHMATIDYYKLLFAVDGAVMSAAFDLVQTYDSQVGPLWVAGSPVQSFTRSAVSNEDINWVIYRVMQAVIDNTYDSTNLVTHAAVLNGKSFASSADFPGAVAPPAAVVTHTATINTSFPDTFGWVRYTDDLPARKPTGTYVAPGTIVTVTVPPAIVNKGYRIRVGAHSWDFSVRPTIKRLDRCTILYDIDRTEIKVGSPIGGGIYIEVPYLANEGVVDIGITGAVRSPFFSSNSVTGHVTTLAQWQNTERHHPAPWADFQTEKCMFQVPTNWIYNLSNPVTVMADWDRSIDYTNDVMGFPRNRGKETFYMQVDVDIRGDSYYPGYPATNDTYNPEANYNGLANHYLIKGPMYAPNHVFHEQGHSYMMKRFNGETESHVNLLYVAAMTQACGMDLDWAFSNSAQGYDFHPYHTMDNTAIEWMTSFNFSPKEVPMQETEKKYQLKGHAKYVDIARLFGWQALNDYHYQLVADNIDQHDTTVSEDDLIVRLAVATGVDIRPLLHFWGIHPTNPASVSSRISALGLLPSNAIYDQLWHYRSIVPRDNAAFRNFATNWWDGPPDITGFQTESGHARQWDNTDLSGSTTWSDGYPLLPNGEIYDESSHARIQARVDELLAMYFPAGDPIPNIPPAVDAGVNQNLVLKTVPPVGWSYTTWTGDADSGISTQNDYRVAHCFGNNHSGSVVVNGVTFTESFASSGTGWSIGGSQLNWEGDDVVNMTGGSEDLAEEFIYNGTPRTVTFTGLAVGRTYEANFYSVAWETGSRVQTFSVTGGDSAVINQDAYGNNNGIRIRCVYTATSSSQTFTITPGAGGTFHLYAITNRGLGALNLDASVNDPEGKWLSATWSLVSGPGQVAFGDPSSIDTTASFTAAGVYVLRLTADDSFDVVSDEVTITVYPPLSNTYVAWSAGVFANAFSAINTFQDPDGDGMNNLTEFAFGTDPTFSDPASLNAAGSVNGQPLARSSLAVGAFDLLFVRRDDHGTSGSVSYTPQFSSDLVTFYDSVDTPSFVADSTDDPAYQIVKVPYPEALPNGKKACFGRVVVTQVP